MVDLTDDDLDRMERAWAFKRRPWSDWNKFYRDESVRRLIAEVRRHRQHKCERGGICRDCGSTTIPQLFCSQCSQ